MLRKFFHKSYTSIGVDVNDSGIAVVVLCKECEKISILHASWYKGDARQQKINFLREFFVKNKIRKKNIYIAVPAWQVIKKELLFDAVLQDIAGLDISMDQPQVMGITQCIDDGFYEFDNFSGIDGFELAAVSGQVPTVDIFHGDECQLFKSMKIKNANNIWVDKATGITAFIFQQVNAVGFRR